MTPLVTVLYEDKMSSSANGGYPLHDLVMRMVEDDINGQTWQLGRLSAKNPRNGVDKIIKDIKDTGLIAGAGKLLVLVDNDRIGEHLGLGNSATDDKVAAELRRRSDAPDKLGVFFLHSNLEGLLRSIQRCAPSLLPDIMQAALRKDLNRRDLVFNEAKKASHRPLRQCVRAAQPGLDQLVKAIAAIVTEALAVPSP
jgi:hypothetical protein